MRLGTYIKQAWRNLLEYSKEFGATAAWQISQNHRNKSAIKCINVRNYRHPIHYREGTTDFILLRTIIGQGAIFSPKAFIPKLIVDAGANIGLVSVFYANLFPDAKVFAIEMEDTNYDVMLKNISPYPGIMPIKAALWNHAEGVSFGASDRHDSFRVEGGGQAKAMVTSITLNDISTDKNNIDILKLDIEGAEVEVLDFMRENNIQPKFLVVELHERFRPGCELALERYLDGRNYKRSKVSEYDVVDFV